MQLKSGAIADTASQEHSILHLIKGELEGVLTRQITVIFFLSKLYIKKTVTPIFGNKKAPISNAADRSFSLFNRSKILSCSQAQTPDHTGKLKRELQTGYFLPVHVCCLINLPDPGTRVAIFQYRHGHALKLHYNTDFFRIRQGGKAATPVVFCPEQHCNFSIYLFIRSHAASKP